MALVSTILELVTVLLLAGTLTVTLRHQTKLMRAELLRDSFSMYWKTYDAVTEDQVREVSLYPDDYFDPETFADRYKGDRKAIRMYIKMSKLYEYLAYSHKLHHLDLEDPFGSAWLTTWLVDLIQVPEFLDVHKRYRSHYPDFAGTVDQMLARKIA